MSTPWKLPERRSTAPPASIVRDVPATIGVRELEELVMQGKLPHRVVIGVVFELARDGKSYVPTEFEDPAAYDRAREMGYEIKENDLRPSGLSQVVADNAVAQSIPDLIK